MTFVVQLKGLQQSISEDDILERLKEFEVEIEYVKLIKDKTTGLGKGKALVKFKEELMAETFLAEHPVIDIFDDPIWVERGFEHSEDDWQCFGCKSLNFSHRESCFKCKKPRKQFLATTPIVLTGNDDISPIPSKFLLLQGLDESFRSEQLFSLVNQFVGGLKRICLVLEKAKRRSKGFAFAQFDSLEESQLALNGLSAAGLFQSVRFGRDLDELAKLSSSAPSGLVYWDPACELEAFPSDSPLQEIDKIDQIVQTKRITKPPVIFTSTRPVKRLQLQKWSQSATSAESEPSNTPNTTPATVELLDFQFLACKLCEEGFGSEAELKLHAQQSQQHADNYEAYLRTELESGRLVHRDRAAERRSVFAIDENEELEQKESVVVDVDVDDSIGAKLLRKMGWKEGKGLGKHGTGIKEPIKAKTVESIGAGLGAASLIDATQLVTGSYSDRAKQARIKRYQE